MTADAALSRRQAGFSMIEVLVTLVILLIGLLGLAGTMVRASQAEIESYQRDQALIMVRDMAARINANRRVADCYAVTTNSTEGTPYLGSSSTLVPTCTSGTSQQQARALQDLQQWNGLLRGVAEKSGTADVGAIEGARGCVTYDATADLYLVSIAWQGLHKTAEPPAAWSCAKGQYGSDEKLRRVASMTVKISNLN